MSKRTTLTALSRSLGAPTRQLPVAGPSRIPLPLASTRSVTTETSAPLPSTETSAPPPTSATTPPPAPVTSSPPRRHDTPKFQGRLAATKLVVRTSKPMSSVLHAYAVLRSIEDTYGSVLDFQVGKDPDSLQPTNIIFFTMAEPVTIDSSRLNEIPAPRSSLNELERYGGPSLEDIRSVLRSDPKRGVQSSGKGKKQDHVITYEVEMRKSTGRSRSFNLKKPSSKSVRQDLRLAEALEKFDGGFFGGFAGLGARYKPLFELHKTNAGQKEERLGNRFSGDNRRRGRTAAKQSEGVGSGAQETVDGA